LDLREISSPPNWFGWSIGVHGIFRWSVKGGGRASKSAPSAVTTAQDPTGQRKPVAPTRWKHLVLYQARVEDHQSPTPWQDVRIISPLACIVFHIEPLHAVVDTKFAAFCASWVKASIIP